MKKKPEIEKSNIHPRNNHRLPYDFDYLLQDTPELKPFIIRNPNQIKTINFSNPKAVKMLNKALLRSCYEIIDWDIPEGYLCPPIPGRVDYIHYIADLLAESNNKIIPLGSEVMGLDIGLGANCIYPLLGNAVYGWSFVGTDSHAEALENCISILEANPKLTDSISLQQQLDPRFIFKNIIQPEDRFAFTLCNPPFHDSKKEAIKGNIQKISGLSNQKPGEAILNFGGQDHELWYEGGELAFITQMIHESAKYPMQCLWFTTLVSKKDHLKSLYKTLEKVSIVSTKTIDMAQGQKISRILAWTFLSEEQQKNWTF